MRPTLDGDIRIRDARRRQLPYGAQEERVSGAYPPPRSARLEEVLQLLEDGVLQDGVYDQDQGGEHACKEGS